MNWSEKHIKGLLSSGKIRGYQMPEKKKGYSKDGVSVPRDKPKGVVWLDLNLAFWCRERGLTLEKEYQFDTDRRWRSDYAVREIKVLLEYEGIYAEKSRHTTFKGYNGDLDKYNRAAELGYRIIRLTAKNYTTALKSLDQLIK